MRCLILYYSMTGQAERAAALIAETTRDAGWEVVTCRIGMPDPADQLARPMRLADTKKWTQGAQRGMAVRVDYTPADALRGDYDLVLLLTNTWGDHPSVPVRSFLQSPEAKTLLAGRPFGVFVVCRRLWEKNLKIVRDLGEAAGGRYIGGEPFMHPGGQLGSLVQTVSYLWGSGAPRKRMLGFRLPPYGLSPEALARLPEFTRSLLAKTAQGS